MRSTSETQTPLPPPIIILGQTATGKSELAVALAERFQPAAGEGLGAEIVSADSMQVYRHLDVGTAKPSREARQRVPHHLIDVVEPTERFTVADWLDQARASIQAIQARGRRPIVVGGTNLYLKALMEGLISGPQPDHAYRRTLNALSEHELHRRLAEVDHQSAQRISPNDRRRMVRALEVYRQTGKPISAMQGGEGEEGTQARRHEGKKGRGRPASAVPGGERNWILIGLGWDREALNRRINARVKRMFFPQTCGIRGETLGEEVRRLVDRGLLGTDQSHQANEAIGYKQCLAALRGEMSWDDAFEKTKIATRRFAKQQRTWLKRFRGVHWLDATNTSKEDLTEQAVKEGFS